MSSKEVDHQPELLAIDSGGTLTDTLVVDHQGRYTVGKHQSTPEDRSEGVVKSFADALGYWDMTPEDGADTLRGTVYSGTAMLNRLLERDGDDNIGILTTRGFEDTLRFGRGIQSWAGLSYSGRLHAREHEHPEPLVPRENIRGVRERIDQHGDVIIPLYEEEAREAVADLLDREVRIICINLLQSYANDVHEQRLKEIAEEVLAERGEDIPIWIASQQNPVANELPRLNTLVTEAYACEPTRQNLYNVRDSLQEYTKNTPFRVLTSSGGTISPEHDWLVETLISGPIGGVFGGEYIADHLDIDNLVCSDVGGTSFDVALITEGHFPTRWDQSLANLMLNIPMVAMDSIGSGTGSYVKVDETSDRIEVGPDSAGHRVGVSNELDTVTQPTVTDCTAMLGYINPDFFLGGDIPIDVDAAVEAVDEQVASPLDEDPYETARGVLDLVEEDMANELTAMIVGLGYSPENYNLISYGGGGPLHAAGYTRSAEFQSVLIPEWAAAFSAFGAACADYSYRYDQSIELQIDPELDNLDPVIDRLTQTMLDLRENVVEAFERDGIDVDEMTYRPSVRIKYTGMLDDLEINVPMDKWEDGLTHAGLRKLINRYDEKFQQIFRRASSAPEMGYTITTVTGLGIAPSPMPTIPNVDVVDQRTPPEAASKGTRPIYWDDDWHEATIWNMDHVRAGNVLTGPAVAEAPSTTMLVPPGYEAELDENRIYHLHQGE